MALQKTITLPNGASGNYIRIGAYTWDRMTREASAHLMLHTSATHAAEHPEASLCLLAKLRLHGSKFDEYLANAVLAGEGVTVIGQLYAAAMSEPLIPGGGFTRAGLDLSDAVNV